MSTNKAPQGYVNQSSRTGTDSVSRSLGQFFSSSAASNALATYGRQFPPSALPPIHEVTPLKPGFSSYSTVVSSNRSLSYRGKLDGDIKAIYGALALGHLTSEEAEARADRLRRLRDGPSHDDILARGERKCRTLAKWKNRRMIAATNPVPPRMAAVLTQSELAYAALVRDRVKMTGRFELSHKEVCDRLNVCTRTVQNAQGHLAQLGWIKVEVRRDPEKPLWCLPNRVTVTSEEWNTWIRLGKAPRPAKDPWTSAKETPMPSEVDRPPHPCNPVPGTANPGGTDRAPKGGRLWKTPDHPP